MTVKLFAAALCSLLLGVASTPQAVRAELVPGAQWPNTGIPFPLPPPPGPGSKAEEQPPRKNGPAQLVHGWEGGPSKGKNGDFAYCVVEGQYDTGHALMLARNGKGELNIGIGIPGAELPKDQQWPVDISVDGKVTRKRNAVAPQRDMLVIANGKDEELYDALMAGDALSVTSATDRIGFALKGTKKALADLRTCVEKRGEVPPFTPTVVSEKAKTDGPAGLPRSLLNLLNAAGLEEVEPVGLGSMPPEKRPADFAWRYGPIFGGVKESTVKEGGRLTELSDAFTDSMKARCTGKSTVAVKEPEDLPGVSLRTGSVECVTDKGLLHVALLFYLAGDRPDDRLFTVIFHEAAEADRALADRATENLAKVIRSVAKKPAD
jgi:hypothetical protein